MRVAFRRLARKRPAAARTTSDTATCAITRPSRRPIRRIGAAGGQVAPQGGRAVQPGGPQRGRQRGERDGASVIRTVNSRIRSSSGNSSVTGIGSGGSEPGEGAGRPAGQQNARDGSAGGEHESFGEELADKPDSGCRPAPAAPPPRGAGPCRGPGAGWRDSRSRWAAPGRRRPSAAPRNWVTGPRMLGKILASRSGSTVTTRARPVPVGPPIGVGLVQPGGHHAQLGLRLAGVTLVAQPARRGRARGRRGWSSMSSLRREHSYRRQRGPDSDPDPAHRAEESLRRDARPR